MIWVIRRMPDSYYTSKKSDDDVCEKVCGDEVCTSFHFVSIILFFICFVFKLLWCDDLFYFILFYLEWLIEMVWGIGCVWILGFYLRNRNGFNFVLQNIFFWGMHGCYLNPRIMNCWVGFVLIVEGSLFFLFKLCLLLWGSKFCGVFLSFVISQFFQPSEDLFISYGSGCKFWVCFVKNYMAELQDNELLMWVLSFFSG